MPDLHDAIEYYRSQGAPHDQQMLIALLREAQQESGGVLDNAVLASIAQALPCRESMLTALVRRVPSLRMADAPNRLEVCGTCPLGHALRRAIEEKWHVQNGGRCPEGGFTYHVTGCMKNCRKGPSVKWNGQLHPQATMKTIERLIRPEEG